MKLKRALLSFFLSLALMVVAGCGSHVETKSISEIKGGLALGNLSARLAMFTLVRQALTLYPDMRRILEVPPDPDLPQICDRPVFISIFFDNSPPLWGVGQQGCVHESILRAVHQITQDKNFAKFYLTNLDKIAVRIDILYNRKQIALNDDNLKNTWIEPGIYGLMLQNGDDLVYQPPFLYFYYSWEPKERGRGVVEKRLRMQLEYLAEAAEVGKNNWDKYPIYRFRVASMLQHRPDFLPLQVLRDAPLIKGFRSTEIGRAAVDTGRYLAKTYNYHNQSFRYKFNPVTMEKNSHFSYDIVRHAGTVYSLLHLYKASRKEEFLPLAQSSIDYLSRHIAPPLLEPELLCVKRDYLAKLGATAMTLIAMCELPDKLLSKVGTPRINRLARFLVEMQRSDGHFYDFYWHRLLGYVPNENKVLFTGEASLALIRYYQKNQNVEWLHATRMAAEYQISQFQKRNKPDTWTIQALAELYEADPKPTYAEACFAMADLLLKDQWGNPQKNKRVPFPDYYGGFDNSSPPRTYTTAMRIEALLAAHRLAYLVEKDPTPYANAILSATRFLLQNQYRRDNTYYVKLPDEVRGAFRGGLIDPEIRMEYCHHAIVALTGAYDIAYMRETGEIPTEWTAEGTQELQDDLEPVILPQKQPTEEENKE